jgi:hypothetical protein
MDCIWISDIAVLQYVKYSQLTLEAITCCEVCSSESDEGFDVG